MARAGIVPRLHARLLEEHGGTFRAQQAVANLRHFEVGRDRRGDPFQLAKLFQLADEIAQVFVLHSEICEGCRAAPIHGVPWRGV
ncbi:hypothetical protein D3C81_1172460 [compost metagenome]